MCKSAAYVGKGKVGGDGSQSNGWHIVGGGYKDIVSSDSDNDPFMVWGRKLLADGGVDYKTSSNYGYGFFTAWLMTHTIMCAGDLPGGLSRTNLILCQRTLESTSPIHLEGINWPEAKIRAGIPISVGQDVAEQAAAEQCAGRGQLALEREAVGPICRKRDARPLSKQGAGLRHRIGAQGGFGQAMGGDFIKRTLGEHLAIFGRGR